MEGKVQHAVAAEVDTLFHDQEKRAQAEVAAKAKKAVEHGVSKVKQIVKDHSELHLYPFEKNHPYPTATAPPLHKDHRILHAVESAEKALLHAIQTEVDTLFHADEKEHPKEKTSGATKKSKDPVATGLQKASTKVKNMQTDRRDWLDKSKTSILEDYLSQEYYLE